MTATADGPVLDEHYFDVMATQAQDHWWYRARRALVADLLEAGGRLPGRRGAAPPARSRPRACTRR